MKCAHFQLQPCTLTSSSSDSNLHSSRRNPAVSSCFSYKEVFFSNRTPLYCVFSSCKCPVRKRFSEHEKHILRSSWVRYRDHRLFHQDIQTPSLMILLSSMDDGFTVNGTQTSAVNEIQETSLKLDQPLQAKYLGSGLIQSLHDAARTTELAVIEHSLSGKKSWFSRTWLGVGRNAWIKTFSYQVAVYSLLQATIDISSRLDGQDKYLDMLVQRSLMRLSAPLEGIIRDELSSKHPGSHEWFWSHQQPMLLTSFINLLESNSRWEGVSSFPGNARRLLPLKLALSCIAAITRLGAARVSCTQFFSLVPPDITGGLMDVLVDFVPIRHAYSLVKDIGMHKEFLLHFGSRAAKSRISNEDGVEEITFWIDLMQKQLQRAIDRERIWSRLTTCERIEVLEKDLAIFGFFIALGRSTQIFLSANGFSVTDYKIESIIRYFIGGSVLYYPQLSSISSYQIYVEVVCEELEWLPFYGTKYTVKLSHDKKLEQEGLSHREVISKILDVCSYWTKSFIKYSLWLEDPLNIKAAKFLSRGHNKLIECRNELRTGKNELRGSFTEDENESTGSGLERYSPMCTDLDTFDKALESVEEALNRLEGLLQELHLSSSTSKRQHLEAACSDLQRIRKLKKEAEFLEASFRAKVASLKEDNDVGSTHFSSNMRTQYTIRNNHKFSNNRRKDGRSTNRASTKLGGLWNFLQHSNRKMEPQLSRTSLNEDDLSQQGTTSGTSDKDCDLAEIHRFEVLKNELIELEKRVQRSNSQMTPDEECTTLDSEDSVLAGSQKLVKVPKKEENIIAKSIDKLKETTNDILQGTQLLAVDTLAATVLIQRALAGDELADKEKKALQRTLTDLASVVPIGILMLLPVTAVGHAAILAAIQRYVPALIPSTYSQERLSLLRQLEKVKEIESGDIKTDENEHQLA